MNCGLIKEKPANSLWSMLAMTSWSGGVSMGWVRVKNLSKFSAPLPHCNQRGNRMGMHYIQALCLGAYFIYAFFVFRVYCVVTNTYFSYTNTYLYIFVLHVSVFTLYIHRPCIFFHYGPKGNYI